MRYVFILIMLPVITFCQKKKDASEEFIKFIDNELKENVRQCSCGKNSVELYDILVDRIKDKQELVKMVGIPDTVFAETVMVACSSYVYNCETKFVSFHFNKENKCIGKSYGQIEDEKYVISGSGIVFDKDTE